MPESLDHLFREKKAILGVIHLPALPGSPCSRLQPDEISRAALEEAAVYAAEGLDGLLIENMQDVPYVRRRVNDAVAAVMTRVATEIRARHSFPVGIQILAGANLQALAVAHAAGLDFIRAEGFVFGHLADEGYLESDAGELLRFRKQIGAESVRVFTDIQKKHSSHALTADLDLQEWARTAAFFGSDGLVITGRFTGESVAVPDLAGLRSQVSIPVLLGSGVQPGNIGDSWGLADGFIVGSWFKKEGNWENALDPGRIREMMREVGRLRNSRG